MAREVIINGIDRNEFVESVDFSSGLGEGATCQIYTIEGMPSIAAFSSIVVKIDGLIVFSGYVGSPKEKWGDNPPRLLGAQYDCYDDGMGFNQFIISGSFSGPANEVIDQVISKVKGDYPGRFNYNYYCQSTTSVTVNVTLDYTYLNDAFDQIASMYSGHWFVTPQGSIYFFTTSMADINKDAISISYKNIQTPYDHNKETMNVVNEVVVIGGEGESEQTEYWTYTSTNNVYRLAGSPEKLQVLWGGDPAYLIPEGFSGDPYKPSDKDFENTYQSTSGNDRTAAAITAVVVHHIAAKTATKADLYQWHVIDNGWSDIGYHWYIHKDGTVEACRPELKQGAHALGHNAYTIGIACEGDYEREDTSMPTSQFNALISKILDVMTRYKINRNNLYYHSDLNSTSCPGKYFPKASVLSAVKNGSASSISYTESTPTPATNSNKKLYIDYAIPSLKAVPTFEPPEGTVITIKYTTSYTVSDKFSDVEAINAVGGRRIIQVIADATILDKATARSQAMAILNQYKNIKETLSLSLVDYKQIYAGDKVYLEWLDRYGLVTSTSGRIWCNEFDDNEMKIDVSLI